MRSHEALTERLQQLPIHHYSAKYSANACSPMG